MGAFAGGLLAGWALFAEPAEAPRRADPVRTTRATEQGARAERPAPETGGPAREDGTSEAVRLDADRKLVVTQPASVEEALRRRMAQIYRERHDGEEIPQDWLDAAVDTALRAVLRAPETHATRSANWVRARELEIFSDAEQVLARNVELSRKLTEAVDMLVAGA